LTDRKQRALHAACLNDNYRRTFDKGGFPSVTICYLLKQVSEAKTTLSIAGRAASPAYWNKLTIRKAGLGAVIALCVRAGRIKVLSVTGALMLTIALADWWVGKAFSLGVLYIFPMMLGAVVLRRSESLVLAVLCAVLKILFDTPASHAEVSLRFAFACLAYFCSALFVTALVQNRKMVIEHIGRVEKEQALRHEVEERLSILVESSPAAILTVDDKGIVMGANNAAQELFLIPAGESLQGRAIDQYLPVLSDALRLQIGPEGFRTAAQCQGRRSNGEIFLANTWFSSYATDYGTRLAAIVVDCSEEMREREEQNLVQLLKYNQIAAAAVSHEVRNLCGSISLLGANLKEKHHLAEDEDYQRLTTLIQGLERVASLDLQSRARDTFEAVSLQDVLDNLRIMIEPGWRDVGGSVTWRLPARCPEVTADPHGLLQAFLNLTQNALRAVEEVFCRQLEISVSQVGQRVVVRFADSGPGISSPEHLFQPLQPGANGTGLGLYISRAIVRSYGGDLRFEPRAAGSCFVVELQAESAEFV
jgi:two-component system, LuxR family, sensor kinase FixL